MARYKPVDRSPRFLPVVLSEQILPGTYEFTLDHMVDNELDLSALDARFNNDETGASAYNPRVMLKIVLLGYCRGLISSRSIERACQQNVQFMAISGDTAPSYTHIAKFVRELGSQIQELFKQVLLTCDRMGLIGKEMFAIDGVKLPGNASKERSGTHKELMHRADRLDKAAKKIIELHRLQDHSTHEQDLDERRQAQIEAIRKEAQRMREFVAATPKRHNRKGQELKSNVSDNDSAKMATSKGVIQGYAAQAAVDAKHQVIVAADALGSGSEQAALLPMIDKTQPVRQQGTLFTADAGYHSHDNVQALREQGIPAMIADGQMRKRDERLEGRDKYKGKPDPLHDKRAEPAKKAGALYRPEDFEFDAQRQTCRCPAGQLLYSDGSRCTTNGLEHHKFRGSIASCGQCELRGKCLRHPQTTKVRQVSFFAKHQASPHQASEMMKRAIDTPQGRALYSKRIGTVEPVFANLRHNKRLNRFTLKGRAKVNTQWHLYCLVHNIEKIAGARR